MLNKSLRMLVAVLLGCVLTIPMVGPATAHTRRITQVYTADWGTGGIHVQAWLGPMEQHPGTMRITLKKRNAAGDFVLVDQARGIYQIGWGYMHTFDPVAGAQTCRAFAKFTSNNHPNISKASDSFSC